MFLKKLILKEKSSSDAYVEHLRSIGMKIGEDVKFYAPSATTIDEQYPWMISIGNHVRITKGVVMLTHDYSWSVLKHYEDETAQKGAIFGASGHINIGDNVFIGMNAMIMRNVNIGNNVIIGSGSVVTKDCLDNGVYAGNPARRIMEVKDFYQKRKEAQLQEAKALAVGYYERFNKKPEKEIFHEYFMLFADEAQVTKSSTFSNKMGKCGNKEDSYRYLIDNKPLFKDYDEFLSYCFDETKAE